MTERIREAHKNRRAETSEDKQARLQRRRAQIVRAVVETTRVDPKGIDPVGAAAPAGAAEADARESDDSTGEDRADDLAATVWETLTEDEALDADLETQPIDEMVLRICRKLGRIPDWVPLPPTWAEAARAAEAEREAGAAPDAADGWPPGAMPQETPPPIVRDIDAAAAEMGGPPDGDCEPEVPEDDGRPDRWARRRESG
jgi:hypothetical protein